MDRRRGSSRPAALAAAAICALGACLTFADGGAAARASRPSVRQAGPVARSAVKFVSRKKAKYAPVDVSQFYQETLGGDGGPPKGLERDLITKSFGDGDFHGRGDHDAAFETFKECMQKGEPFEGPDDGSGWIWAAADLSVEGGLHLELRRSTPVGMRALMVAQADNVDEMFESLNWSTVRPAVALLSHY